MSELPVTTAKKILRALLKMGFFIDHQKGSHARLIHKEESWRKVTLPIHDKDLPRRTLKNILDQAEISIQQLLEYL